MADLLASFETGFERPSLDNPLLFSRYADEIAMRLGHQYPEHSGYRIRVEKREDNPRKRKWEVELLRGWFTGVSVVITPLAQTPHRARVKVRWNSRLLGLMAKGFVIISFLPMLIFFIALTAMTRLGFAVIVICIVGVIWAIVGSIVMTLLARLVALVFGDDFDNQTRIALADKIQQFPLPKPPSTQSD